MNRYLIFPDLMSAKVRSNQQAIAQGCQPPTLYWWGTIQNQTTMQGAVVIDDSGQYGTDGLTDAEIAALIPQASMDPSWFPSDD